MKKIAEFFQEANGQLSQMRLMTFGAFCVAVVLTFKSGSVSYDLILTWLGVAVGGKGFSKLSEKKV